MLINGKFINVVHPSATQINKPSTNDGKDKNIQAQQQKNEFLDIKQDVQETKEILRALINEIRNSQQKTVIIEKGTPTPTTEKNDNDIFSDVHIEQDSGTDLDANIHAAQDKVKKNINDDIDLLMNLHNEQKNNTNE